MVVPSVTCHSPSVAANNTTEQLTCVLIDHIHVLSVHGMYMWGGGGGRGGGGQMMHAVQSTICNHVHVRSTTLDQISCQFGIVMKNCLSVITSSPIHVLRITINIHPHCMYAFF